MLYTKGERDKGRIKGEYEGIQRMLRGYVDDKVISLRDVGITVRQKSREGDREQC